MMMKSERVDTIREVIEWLRADLPDSDVRLNALAALGALVGKYTDPPTPEERALLHLERMADGPRVGKLADGSWYCQDCGIASRYRPNLYVVANHTSRCWWAEARRIVLDSYESEDGEEN